MPVDDIYTVALLHMDGADASTTFTDESGKTWTAAGNTQIDTAQSKFGGASALFDGSGDNISSADSADWRLDGGSNSNAWTIDFWVRFDTGGGALQAFVNQYTDGNNYWQFLYNTGTLQFLVTSGGSTTISVSRAWSPSTGVWYHIALVKNGTAGYVFYVDGTNLGAALTDTDVLPDLTGTCRIGLHDGSNWPLKGWMDEVRISKGIARWTADFTPPTAAYAPPASSNFLMFM